jgi:hypothetical protein
MVVVVEEEEEEEEQEEHHQENEDCQFVEEAKRETVQREEGSQNSVEREHSACRSQRSRWERGTARRYHRER